MLNHIWQIFIKEWEDFQSSFFSLANFQVGAFTVLVMCAAVGIYLPIELGATWIDSPIMLLSFIVIIPMSMIAFISPNSFVGERIAKTLEPLLATPARNFSILIGKTGMSVIFGWGVALVNMLVGLIVVNIFHSDGEALLYPIDLLIMMVLGSLLFSIFISVAGMNSSLYSATILEAQNKLGMALLIPFFIPLFMFAFAIGPLFPKNWDFVIVNLSNYFNAINLLSILFWLFLIVDLLLFMVVLIRFDRERLIMGEFYSK